MTIQRKMYAVELVVKKGKLVDSFLFDSPNPALLQTREELRYEYYVDQDACIINAIAAVVIGLVLYSLFGVVVYLVGFSLWLYAAISTICLFTMIAWKIVYPNLRKRKPDNPPPRTFH